VKRSRPVETLPFEAEEVLNALGMKIALARRARAWTQADLAAKMGVSVNTVVSLEKGRASVAFGQVVMALWLLDGLDALRQAARLEDDPVIQKEAMNRLPKRVRGSNG
jgi:transcriptional regulator with XRE-family HTH domain